MKMTLLSFKLQLQCCHLVDKLISAKTFKSRMYISLYVFCSILHTAVSRQILKFTQPQMDEFDTCIAPQYSPCLCIVVCTPSTPTWKLGYTWTLSWLWKLRHADCHKTKMAEVYFGLQKNWAWCILGWLQKSRHILCTNSLVIMLKSIVWTKSPLALKVQHFHLLFFWIHHPKNLSRTETESY